MPINLSVLLFNFTMHRLKPGHCGVTTYISYSSRTGIYVISSIQYAHVHFRNITLGVAAITCFLHACRHPSEPKSRKYLARAIWMLTYDDEKVYTTVQV